MDNPFDDDPERTGGRGAAPRVAAERLAGALLTFTMPQAASANPSPTANGRGRIRYLLLLSIVDTPEGFC